MNKIYFATGNKGKAEEAQEILGIKVEIADVEMDEIQSMDLNKIVEHKVKQAYSQVKSPVFVDDVSIEFDVWKGFPGPFIKYLQNLGNETILYMMRNETNRNLNMIATIAYYDGKIVNFFSGNIKGVVSNEKRGERGWGFDQIVIPEGHTLTFAEMSLKEKNMHSHRRMAMDKLKKFLDSKVIVDEV